jgi:hypothetical protein
MDISRRRRRRVGIRVVLCGLGRKLREELAAMELLLRMDPQQALDPQCEVHVLGLRDLER